MPYDHQLAGRVRDLLAGLTGYTERPWSGGLRFCLSRRTCCGVIASDLIVRVADDEYDDALARPHSRPFGVNRAGRRLVAIAPEGWRVSRALALWVTRGVEAALAARADEISRAGQTRPAPTVARRGRR